MAANAVDRRVSGASSAGSVLPDRGYEGTEVNEERLPIFEESQISTTDVDPQMILRTMGKPR
jgi:hypothetical protein